MTDAVILQFRRPVTIPMPTESQWYEADGKWHFLSEPPASVLFPAELWPSEPAVSSQCGRSCSPDDCDAPRCYQR